MIEQKSRILIVDDDENMRETLSTLLTLDGYDLHLAENGRVALSLAEKVLPDVILLDVMMPVMDGFEVCKRIRNNPSLSNIPVIMVTALDDKESLLKGLESGADDFLSKPFDRSELRARIKTTTTLNRYRRLLSERAKFEWVINHSENGYLIINETDNIIFANTKAQMFLGINPLDNNIYDKKFKEIASRQYKLEPVKAWEAWPPTDKVEGSLYLVKPENEEFNAFWLKADILTIPIGSKYEQIICLSDVSPEISSQINLRSFHNMVLHKLRTPSSGLIGGLEVLSVINLNSLSTEQINQFVTMAFNSVKKLNESIEDILQYIKIPLITRTQNGFPASQIQGTISEITGNLELKSISFKIEKSINNLNLKLSQRALEIISWEILENSKKFHPLHDPLIEISISLINESEILIRFIDNGKNLSPEVLSRAWDPYFQGEKRFTGNIKGMGLGLSTIASLMWSIDGNCKIFNRDGQPGIIVELSIPLMTV